MNKTNSDFDYKSALCAQTDPELFFPKTWQSSTVVASAKAICANCPVKLECLQEAINHDYNDGIWGGMTPPERYALIKGGRTDRRWRSASRSLRPRGDKSVIQITKKGEQMNTDFMTAKDLAEFAGLPYRHLWTYRKRGILPMPDTYIGNKPLWLRTSVLEWDIKRKATDEVIAVGGDGQ